VTRVLVVDDDPSVRRVLRDILTLQHVEVIEADNGQRALDILVDDVPDLVLLDVTMPQVDGMAVLERVQEIPAVRHVPIIMLTGRTGSAAIMAGLDRGASDYITKPFEIGELTARVRASLRTSALLAELASRNRELDQFAERVSRELRSPLTVLKGGTILLRRRWDQISPVDRSYQLRTMEEAADRAAHMIESLIALAGLERVEVPETVGATDAHAVAQAVVAAMPARLGDHTSIEGDWQLVAVPEADLTVTLTHLIDNASLHGRGPTGSLRLRIVGHPADTHLHVDVIDDGPGVPDGEANRVFDPFYVPADGICVPPGTGAGLAIVRRATERWGGRVSIDPGDPSGTRIRLTLPLAQPD
jgi:signal transduction histidine kinase